jgi:hypothetical protein
MKIGGLKFQIDHSFKVPKLLAKVAGEQVFEALFTVSNENGEIRLQFFVHSKGHADIRQALASFNTARELMGHGRIQVIYTDNVVADKSFLESIFPYLKEGIYVPPASEFATFKNFQWNG